MKITPQNAVDRILERSPQVLKQHKHHSPVLFAIGESASATVSLGFKDADSRHSAMIAAGREVAFLKPYCVALAAEAWMVRAMPPEGKSVSDMPDKEEALQVIAQNLEGETRAAAIPFSRVGEEILLGERIESSEAESYLLELFWEGVRHGSE